MIPRYTLTPLQADTLFANTLTALQAVKVLRQTSTTILADDYLSIVSTSLSLISDVVLNVMNEERKS